MNANIPLNDSGVSLPPGTAAIAPRDVARVLAERWARVLARRHHRPWLALVAVPLALVAAVCSFAFWLVLPLLALSWWWAPADWPWGWLLAVLEACFGVQWVYLGAALLAYLPSRPLAAGLWVLYAAFVAAVGMENRRLSGRRYGW